MRRGFKPPVLRLRRCFSSCLPYPKFGRDRTGGYDLLPDIPARGMIGQALDCVGLEGLSPWRFPTYRHYNGTSRASFSTGAFCLLRWLPMNCRALPNYMTPIFSYATPLTDPQDLIPAPDLAAEDKRLSDCL